MTEIRLSATGASLLLTSESDGSGDYLVAIYAEADGFKGHADGHVIGAVWQGFCSALTVLEKTRKGEAKLESAMSGEFSLSVGAINGKGHMGVSGVLAYGRTSWPRQSLMFAFEFEPSQLTAVQQGTPADRYASDSLRLRVG